MGLLNPTRHYEMKAKCFNCGYKFILKIPHGILTTDYLESGKALCTNCKTDNIAVDVPEVELEEEKKQNGISKKETEKDNRRGIWS